MATALATRPAVLVLDEPTFGQDRGHLGASWWRCSPSSRTRAARSSLVTHDAAVVGALADDVLELRAAGEPVAA